MGDHRDAAGAWASIIGFPLGLVSLGITIFVAMRVRSLTSRLILRARLPKDLEQLRELKKELALALAGGTLNVVARDSSLTRCRALLVEIKQGATGNARRSVLTAVKAINGALKRAKKSGAGRSMIDPTGADLAIEASIALDETLATLARHQDTMRLGED